MPGSRQQLAQPLLLQQRRSGRRAADEHAAPGDDVETGLAPAPQTSSILRLLREGRPERWTLLLASLFLAVGSLATLAVPKLAGGLIDACTQAAAGTLTPAAARAVLDRQLLLVVAVMAVAGVASGVRAYLFNAAAERVMARLRTQLFAKLVQQEVAFFDVTAVGELSNRLAEDTRAMKDAATTSISMALRSLMTVTLGAVFMFVTSWRLACLVCGTLPPMLVMFRTYALKNKQYTQQQLAAAAAAAATAQEVLAGIRTVKSFAQEGRVTDRYSAAVHQILQFGLRSSVAGGVFTAAILPYGYVSLMTVLWYGAVLVLAGQLSLGDLNAFLLYAIFVAGSAGGLAGTVAQVIAAVGAGKRVFQLMDRAPALPPAGDAEPPRPPQGASLAFRGVSFAYPSRAGAWVLRDFDLQVSPGQSVALVGPSGQGKSTVAKLIQRFYDPQQGTILLNSVPLPQLSNTYLHQAVAMVAQEPLVFADTIKANILFGTRRSDVTQAEIEAAAIAAHAHEFITTLPKGYGSMVGEQGVMLSGGQKQRLAIARALLTQPQLLLLDEATSALDAESEHLVQQALQEAAKGRSVVVIAHRLSTVRGSDLVAVVQHGRVVEQGAHSELMGNAGGAYAQLVQRQVVAGGSMIEGGSSGNGAPPSPAGGAAAATQDGVPSTQGSAATAAAAASPAAAAASPAPAAASSSAAAGTQTQAGPPSEGNMLRGGSGDGGTGAGAAAGRGKRPGSGRGRRKQ